MSHGGSIGGAALVCIYERVRLTIVSVTTSLSTSQTGFFARFSRGQRITGRDTHPGCRRRRTIVLDQDDNSHVHVSCSTARDVAAVGALGA